MAMCNGIGIGIIEYDERRSRLPNAPVATIVQRVNIGLNIQHNITLIKNTHLFSVVCVVKIKAVV